MQNCLDGKCVHLLNIDGVTLNADFHYYDDDDFVINEINDSCDEE